MTLFGKKTDEKPSPFTTKPNTPQKGTTLLGKNLMITGTITGEDDIQFFGALEGTLDVKSNLQVGQSARVKGELIAETIHNSGTIDGTVTARAKIHMDPTSRIEGIIHTPRFSVAEGAYFNGEIKMMNNGRPIQPTQPPPPVESATTGKKK